MNQTNSPVGSGVQKTDYSSVNDNKDGSVQIGQAGSSDKNSPAHTFKSVVVPKLSIILVIVVLLYVFVLINKLTDDKLDWHMSMYPRNFKRIWAIFTCTFIHDNITHLNAIILFFLVCAVCVIVRGSLRFVYISLFIIVLGNLLSWFFGTSRMNGITGWTCGLLANIYCSLITDIGYPIHCTKYGIESFIIAVVLTILMVILLNFDFIPTSTACWQYNVCGALMGVVATFLFTSSPLKKKQTVSQETPQESTPDGSNHRVMVGKKLIKFDDLRNPLLCRV